MSTLGAIGGGRRNRLNIPNLPAKTVPGIGDKLLVFDPVTGEFRSMLRSDFRRWDFISTPTTLALGTLYTFAHGLVDSSGAGITPTDVLVKIRANTTSSGWSSGNEMVFAIYGDSNWTSHQGVGWDATNVYVWANASALAGFIKTGGGANLTSTQWDAIVMARR